MKRILVLGTGGTIAMVRTDAGLGGGLPSEEVLRLARIQPGSVHIVVRDLLNIDSSLMQPEDWVLIARAAYQALDSYDGIVVTHGTDTMAYTASMLSFMLGNLPKPIVLTGAMRPVSEPDSDAPRNLSNAISFAMEPVGGVYVAFGGLVIRGCRASKVDCSSDQAFYSINQPPVATFDADGHLRYTGDVSSPKGPACLDTRYNDRIFLLKLFPGSDPKIVPRLVEMGIRGIVVESFGMGGLPYRRRDLLQEVEKVARQIPVVLASQVLYGGVDLDKYEVGRRALDAGVIPSFDMTKETCVTKLMWALGKTSQVDEVRRIMLTNYAGELALPKLPKAS